MPGIINSVDLEKMTCTVQPSIKANVRKVTGAVEQVNLPLCVDVPIMFPRGGGYLMTFPIAAGDECLLVFSSRCIDGWWQHGGVQPPLDGRMHDLSDAFAIPGPHSQATLPGEGVVSATSARLSAADGVTFAEVDGPNQTVKAVAALTSVVIKGLVGEAEVVAPTKVLLTTPLVHATGNITAAGDITAHVP